VEFVFIRHGQPRWSVDGISRPDPMLTPLGRDQARLTADRLLAATRPVTEILVSPAQRSQETAAPLAASTGVAPTTIPDLVEIQMPDWNGQPEETVQRIFNEARGRPPEEWWEGISGGESFRTFHERVTEAMCGILAERDIAPDAAGRPHLWEHAGGDDRIAIVAHGGTNAVALSFLLGVDPTPWEWERFVLAHASIARVRAIPLAGGHVFSLRSFNDQEHLPAGLRSR
jgi:probable phosphoglycerate mutase